MIHTARDIAATTYAPPVTRPERTHHPDLAAIEAVWQAGAASRQDYADHRGAASCPPGHNCQHRLGNHAAAAKRSRDKRKS